ncbi:sortase domain-bontaining protein [Actinomycetospora straminea]|uniref:Class F sortase n=1 Tax=Actinomycetospora straminea TaxID=663607 RepID=A0ABP9E9G8_9PSEU|nr:sortase [Actinomycetospora straminea]MDD7936009.1 sortase [Actinomycetospora straminea]
MATTTEHQSTQQRGTARATIGVLLVVALVAVVAYLTVGATSARTGPAVADLPAGRTEVALPLDWAETANLRIPSIGVDTRQLTELGQTEDRRLEVPRDATTVGHYRGGAAPGQDGPAVYASHVDYGGVEGGFARLSDVEAGDQVLVERTDGVTVVYAVDRVAEVPKDAFPTVQVYGATPGPELRLITCGGEFDADVRSYEDNVVVYGHAVEAYR